MTKKLIILGTRGIPARHGGFETFCEKLSLFLATRGWLVTVYCQEGAYHAATETFWEGIRRIHIPVRGEGAAGTVLFDYKASLHAMNEDGLVLVLGYNTAVFNLMQRLKRQITVFNMDGIEWRRDKWGVIAKIWFWLNERAACRIGNHLIADHPEIKKHLGTRAQSIKISMIPYGAEDVVAADAEVLTPYNIKSTAYSTIIARPEPENSLLEIVRAFSRATRNHKLVILGKYAPERNMYHRMVMEAASGEVIFVGAIFDDPVVQALRFHSRFYLHGHRVGGTNPSLVEAMGAGCAVIAHDNQFNRWVAGRGAAYFTDESSCAALFDRILHDDVAIDRMREHSRKRFRERFTWDNVLGEYEKLLNRWYPA